MFYYNISKLRIIHGEAANSENVSFHKEINKSF